MRTLTIAVIALLALPAAAADEKPKSDRVSVDLQVPVGGKPLSIRATAGLTIMKDDAGKAKAEIFSIAYLQKPPAASRPVTFAFNGGPGSSSVWLHMGGLGPRRVVMQPEGWRTKPPYRHDVNEQTWLPFTDLVFIDPVSTGFSRPAKGEKKGQFHGLHEDARSVADFIRQWLTDHDRWLSPIYLVGESYGTTRAAMLSTELLHRGIDVSGIVLVSPVLNFQASDARPGNDLGYWLVLPTMAATAHYHGLVKTENGLREFLDEVEEFARTEYLLALAKGAKLAGEPRDAIAAKLAKYTGLSKEYVLSTDLRVWSGAFRKELMRHSKGSVGRYDSRFTARDRVPAGSHADEDPSWTAVRGPFTSTLNDWLRKGIGYRTERVYNIFGNVHPWPMGRERHRYTNTAESLAAAMRANPHLRVLVAMGYYDFATPYFAAEYTFEHLGWPNPENYEFTYYEAGHMMYIRDADRAKLTADAARFYAPESGSMPDRAR
ncbi:MAG: peptidase S10 [Planctomycetota bacterium]